MPLDLDRFIQTRPCRYHLTATRNAERILSSHTLRPAADAFIEGGQPEMIRSRRRGSCTVPLLGDTVHIRDQAPLHPGNVALAPGWSFEDLVEHLNRHVFFWPGTDLGPIPYGVRHFHKYAGKGKVVLILNTAEVFAANESLPPRFCRYNSGSPRCSGGKPSPRGPGTFALAHDYIGTPGSVVEVTFPGPVTLAGCRASQRDPREFK